MNKTITFIEKAPYESNTLWFKGKYYPNYMLKDGAEYFLWNRAEPSDRFDNEEYEERKKHLIENGGTYFKFYDHSKHNHPLDILKWVIDKGYTFEKCTKAQYLSDGKCFDFSGNLRQVSSAFFYRIYDKALADEIIALLKTAKKEKGVKL